MHGARVFCIRTRLFATVTAAIVIGCATFTPAGASASTAGAAHEPTLNTRPAWDGAQYVWEFGCADTATYGQVITVPEGKTRLTKFNFYLSDQGRSGSMVVRGEVYAWDGSKATGDSLWESHPRTVDYGDKAYHRKQFRPHGVVHLQAQQQYVIFLSISKDYDQCTNSYQLNWGAVDDDTYPDGTFVFINNGGRASQWTTRDWTTNWGYDLAFKAWLS